MRNSTCVILRSLIQSPQGVSRLTLRIKTRYDTSERLFAMKQQSRRCSSLQHGKETFGTCCRHLGQPANSPRSALLAAMRRTAAWYACHSCGRGSTTAPFSCAQQPAATSHGDACCSAESHVRQRFGTRSTCFTDLVHPNAASYVSSRLGSGQRTGRVQHWIGPALPDRNSLRRH